MSKEILFELPDKDVGWIEPMSKAKIAGCNESQSPQYIFDLINGTSIDLLIDNVGPFFREPLSHDSETLPSSKGDKALYDKNQVRISQGVELFRNFPDFVSAPKYFEKQRLSFNNKRDKFVIPFPRLRLVK